MPSNLIKGPNGMSKSVGRCVSVASLMASVFLSTVAFAQIQRGKEITIVVGSGPNGTMDTNARQIGLYLGRHLPGNPNVVVQNMPGANSLIAANYIYEVAKPDGQTLYYGTWFPLMQILKSPELKVQYDKLGIIGAGGETRAVVMRRDLATRIDKPQDIVKANGFVVGSTGTGDGHDMLNRMSLDLLGAKYKLVTGYEDGPQADLAIARGEIDFENNSYATIVRQKGADVKSGKLLPIYYFCTMDEGGNIRREDFIKDTPCYIDLYKDIYGKLPSGDLFDALNFYVKTFSNLNHILAVPPGTPQDDLAQLREAYAKAIAEPGFVDFFVKQTGFGPELTSLEDAQRVIQSVGSVTPNEVAVLRKYYEAGNR
jgi:tripartite-type tricarboxylate transporter receptor subunit TctC